MAVYSYKCPNCLGPLAFDPDSQTFSCEYCLGSFTKAEIEASHIHTEAEQISDAAEAAALNATAEAAEMLLYRCPSCGAQVVTDATTAADTCYYCHNHIMLEGRLGGEYAPARIIPFAISKEQAQQRFFDWVKSKSFVPKSFFSKKQAELISGVYFPYWINDVDLYASANGRATDVNVWRAGNIEYTRTKTYRLRRAGNIHFEDITNLALSGVDRELVTAVQPFDPAGMRPFEMPYLSGFVAKRRDIEAEQLQDEVERKIHDYSAELLRDSVSGHGSVSMEEPQVQIKNLTWDYTLLPVWVLTYRGADGKLYYYALNGQTGQLAGKLPVDKGKLSLTALGVFALTFILGVLIGGVL
ncbi:MAG: TFIIB-type zinc ribbon-containing protein [Firmicutes bacterium]|nr:TFIIB-type zinc ribbon-containing protein [Bacillota bacterium]